MGAYIEILHEIADLIKKSEELRMIFEKRPQEIDEMESSLGKKSALLEKLEKDLDSKRKELATLDLSIHSNRILMKKYENQTFLVKKSKELAAINNEIYAAKRNVEDEVKKRDAVADEMAGMEEKFQKIKDEVEIMTAEISSQKEKLEAQFEELRPEYERAVAFKKELLKKIPPHVVAVISDMEKAGKFQNSIMASVNNGQCGVCKMAVPPQLVSEVRRENEIKTCPYCGRILFWDRT